MTIRNAFAPVFSGATQAGLSSYGQALHELQCFVGDPVGSVGRAIADAPGFVMAHVLKGYLFGLATERDAMAVTAACHAAALPLAASTHERAHVAALGHLASGRWQDASRILEDITNIDPEIFESL